MKILVRVMFFKEIKIKVGRFSYYLMSCKVTKAHCWVRGSANHQVTSSSSKVEIKVRDLIKGNVNCRTQSLTPSTTNPNACWVKCKPTKKEQITSLH